MTRFNTRLFFVSVFFPALFLAALALGGHLGGGINGDADGEYKRPPTIEENFFVYTTEVDDSNTTILEQTLVWDQDARRSSMLATGTLVHGLLQQIRRCDLIPSGYSSQVGGPNPAVPSTWSCENYTIPLADEGPDTCQYNGFWNFPFMRYVGQEYFANTDCDKWTYWMNDEQYAFWTVEDKAVPVASGKVYSDSYGLWTLYFTGFIPGSPPLSDFEGVDGCTCPDVPYPSSKAINANNETVKEVSSSSDSTSTSISVSSYSDLMKRANNRVSKINRGMGMIN